MAGQRMPLRLAIATVVFFMAFIAVIPSEQTCEQRSSEMHHVLYGHAYNKLRIEDIMNGMESHPDDHVLATKTTDERNTDTTTHDDRTKTESAPFTARNSERLRRRVLINDERARQQQLINLLDARWERERQEDIRLRQERLARRPVPERRPKNRQNKRHPRP
ncbi:hypothetical protein OS493_029436 [Desmophyllum pertusum]|uniref:Transmembrane protein n=1 Tax=Desmophyllum pertusum TaxID=174260 RepID=A0A9W9YK22_9CNID|nr:hypothetical protein OS493_029436 [Desmophyllum pertusum]